MEKEVQERINQAFECIPTRFHDEFAEVINCCEQTTKSVRKNEEMFLDEIMSELTEDEYKAIFGCSNKPRKKDIIEIMMYFDVDFFDKEHYQDAIENDELSEEDFIQFEQYYVLLGDLDRFIKLASKDEKWYEKYQEKYIGSDNMKIQGTITIDGVTLYDVICYARRDDDNEERIELNNSNGSIVAMLYVKDIKYCEVNEQDEDGRYTGEITPIIDDGEIICDKLL